MGLKDLLILFLMNLTCSVQCRLIHHNHSVPQLCQDKIDIFFHQNLSSSPSHPGQGKLLHQILPHWLLLQVSLFFTKNIGVKSLLYDNIYTCSWLSHLPLHLFLQGWLQYFFACQHRQLLEPRKKFPYFLWAITPSTIKCTLLACLLFFLAFSSISDFIIANILFGLDLTGSPFCCSLLAALSETFRSPKLKSS